MRVALKPAAPNKMTLTAKDNILVDYAEQWCVYALPKTLTLPASPSSVWETALTAALDKPASFGECSSTRSIGFFLQVSENEFGSPLEAETVG